MLEPLEFYSDASAIRQPMFGNCGVTETSRRVARYFETSGFSRWAAIYGEGGIPPIWRVIREGHDRAMDQVLEWATDDGRGTVLDAGCGTGKLSVRLANCGYEVHGFDISAPMVSMAKYLSQNPSRGLPPEFFVGDIAAVEQNGVLYDVVCCLDVLFHYPYDEVAAMLERLASVCRYKLIGSFALRTPLNSLWMYIGRNFFHRKNRMTNLFMLSYDDIERVLYRAGFRVTRTHRVKRLFYDSKMFEAVRR